MNPSIPPDGCERLALVSGYGIEVASATREFDDIVLLAATVCETPIALIALEKHLRFPFHPDPSPPDGGASPDTAFLSRIPRGAGVAMVPDVLEDSRFAVDPWTAGDPWIRFYAAVSLVDFAGREFGILGVMDRVPRTLAGSRVEALRMIGRQVADRLATSGYSTTGVPSGAGADSRETRLLRAESAMRESEESYRALFEQAAMGICVVSIDGRFLRVNEKYCAIVGYSAEELIDRVSRRDLTYPADREADRQAELLLSAGAGSHTMEKRYVHKEGRIVWVRLTLSILRSSPGESGFIGFVTDITERKIAEISLLRTNRALQLFSRCNEALTHSDTERELVDGVCRIALETGGYAMAWIGYVRNDRERSLVPQAHAALSGKEIPDLRLSWSDRNAAGRSVAGEVIRTGRAIFLPDLEGEGFFRPWLDYEEEQGCVSVACLPLKDQLRTFGVLTLYQSESRMISGEEMRLLQDLANDMAFGIVNLRAGVERRKTHDAVLAMARGVSACTGREFFEKLVFCAVEVLGAHAGFIARLDKAESRATTISAVAEGRLLPNFEYEIGATPCARLRQEDEWMVPENARTLYPHAGLITAMETDAYAGTRLSDAAGNPIGVMFLLFRRPLDHLDFIASTLKVFGSRAGGEMERQKSEMQLREQAELLDKARDAILVHDFEHRISYWNRSAERLYGWSSEEAVGRVANHLLYDDAASLAIAVETTLTKGEWVGEFEQRNKDGRTINVEARWSLVRDAGGDPKSILSINTDITERRKLEQQFLRTQRMESIGTLAGGIAHDINNVLSPIMMSIDLLRMYVSDPDAVRIIDMVGASAKRGAEMVRKVLSFARGVEGGTEEVEIAPIFDDLLRIIEETFPKNIRVESRLHSDLWRIRADATQIHQVLLNLCVNARDAMPDGGRISLRAQNMLIDEMDAVRNIEAHAGPYLTIEIEDSGHGIPAGIIDRIFDPFFTTKEQGKGTGLGLSTSLAIMKNHGGFFRVFSEPGSGTRFRLYLPALTDIGWTADESPVADLPRGRGETVMVVDDELYVRKITCQTLETFGYKVLLAANGSEAVSSYVRHRNEISVVLTDMMMPVMDGPATVRVLRRLNPNVRIIGASGLNATEKVSSATNAGVNHFLPKPYTAETLLKAIQAILCDVR